MGCDSVTWVHGSNTCWMGVHIGAAWRIRLNRPCVAAMPPFCRTTALQPVATCRQSPYLRPVYRQRLSRLYYHDVILIMTSLAPELATPSVTDEGMYIPQYIKITLTTYVTYLFSHVLPLLTGSFSRHIVGLRKQTTGCNRRSTLACHMIAGECTTFGRKADM